MIEPERGHGMTALARAGFIWQAAESTLNQNKAQANHIEAGRNRGELTPRKVWSPYSSGQGGINVSPFTRGSTRQLGVFAANRKHMTGHSCIRGEHRQFDRRVYRFYPVLLGSVKSKSQDGKMVLLNLTDLTDYLLGATCAHPVASGCARARGSQLDPERVSVKSVKWLDTGLSSCGFRFTVGSKTGANSRAISVKYVDSCQQSGVIA